MCVYIYIYNLCVLLSVRETTCFNTPEEKDVVVAFEDNDVVHATPMD